MKRFALACVVALLLAAPAVAQESNEIDDYIKILKSDIATESREIVAEVMQFTDVEAKLFWPIYDDYLENLEPISDRRIALIREIAESWPQIPDGRAKAMGKESLDIEAETIELRRATFDRITKALNATTASKWLQIDNRLRLLVQLQIAAELPIIP